MGNLSPGIAEARARGRALCRGHFKYQMKVQTRDAAIYFRARCQTAVKQRLAFIMRRLMMRHGVSI